MSAGLRIAPWVCGALLLSGCTTGDQGSEDPWEGTWSSPPQDSGGHSPIEELDPAALPTVPSACREPVLVEVTEGVDGDTIWADPIEGGREQLVRLIGIDTPEIAWDGGTSECWAVEAQDYTQRALEGRLAWLTFDLECIDPYNRQLAYVHLGAEPGDFFNVEALRQGYGEVMIIPPNDGHVELLWEAEAEAQEAEAGVWSCP